MGGRGVSEFARFCGLNQQTVDRYVKGERSPNGAGLSAIAVACGVSADWLLGISDARRYPELTESVRDRKLYDEPVSGESGWRELALSQQRVIERLSSVLAGGAAAPARMPGAVGDVPRNSGGGVRE
jgi:transcriptional regulator with XRE-family HTH domain